MNLRRVNKTQNNISNDIFDIEFDIEFGITYISLYENYLNQYSPEEIDMFYNTKKLYYNNIKMSDYIKVKIYYKFYTIFNDMLSTYYIAVITEDNTLCYILIRDIFTKNKKLFDLINNKLNN